MGIRDQILAARGVVAARAGRSGRRATSGRGSRGLWGSARGVVALEFAIMSIPFFILVLGTLEVCYDMFTQSVLNNALYTAVRALQTGSSSSGSSTSATAGADFVTAYLCPALGGLLECNNNVFINVQQFDPQPILNSKATTDYWNATTGLLPTIGNNLNLAAYQGSGDFCVVTPGNFILVSAIYIGPSLIGSLLPNILSVQYNGHPVHATLSTYGVATELFTSPVQSKSGPSLCQ